VAACDPLFFAKQFHFLTFTEDAFWTKVFVQYANQSEFALSRSECYTPIFQACDGSTKHFPDVHQAGKQLDIFRVKATSAIETPAFAYFDIGLANHEILVWLRMSLKASALKARMDAASRTPNGTRD
jgi:hypothetical protein